MFFYSWICSYFVSIFSTKFFIWVAHYLNFLDKPITSLKTQKKPVAYLGGLALFSSFCLMFFFTEWSGEVTSILLIHIGLFFLMLLGLLDDKFAIKASHKFIGQSLIVVFILLPIVSIIIPCISSFWLLVLVGLWLLTIINCINLIDVMDGLASTTIVCILINLLILAVLQNNFLLQQFFLIWIGLLLGFMYFNFPQAQIYLGDAGSLMLGGLVGVSSLLVVRPYSIMHFLIPLIVLVVPILECLFLIIIRYHKKIPFYMGSPDHFALYLKRKGWSIKKILFFIMIISILIGLIVISIFFNKVSFFELFLHGLLFLAAWCMIIYAKNI